MTGGLCWEAVFEKLILQELRFNGPGEEEPPTLITYNV